MDLEGRRSSYSMNRVLEEVQQQKTKEQQLQQRRSAQFGDSDSIELSSAGCNRDVTDAIEEEEAELKFQPGFVSQLLGKFGGQAGTVGGSSPAPRLLKASSVQNLAPTSPGTAAGGVALRRSAAANTVPTVARRRSQEVGGTVDSHGINGNASGVAQSPTSTRVLIIPKPTPPPVVKRWQHQQQQQQQKNQAPSPAAHPEPLKSPSLVSKISDKAEGISASQPESQPQPESAEKFVQIPSDSSLPIKNMVQAKRNLFEQQQQQRAVSHSGTNGGVAMPTAVAKPNSVPQQHQPHRQPVIGAKQFVPRPVEIIKAKPPVSPAKPILPSRLSVSPSVAMATAAATTTTTKAAAEPSVAKPTTSTGGSDGDGYGFGLPVPQLKSSLPFNGENLKRVQLSEQAVIAMRKAGKSWFFGTNVAEAPEGTIPVKLTPNDRPFSLVEHEDSNVDELTEERRAQTTVWDHVRNADSNRQRVDPGLAAEAKRLMASAKEEGEAETRRSGGPSAASIAERRNKKVLCFKRDSVLEETYEYQSEQSLINELRITPDYPTGPFEICDSPTSPTIDEADELAPSDGAKKVADSGQNGGDTKTANGPGGIALRSAGTPTAMATYKSKLTDEFVWGARNSGSIEEHHQQQQQPKEPPVAAVGDSLDGGPVDDPDAQWSASASSDILF